MVYNLSNIQIQELFEDKVPLTIKYIKIQQNMQNKANEKSIISYINKLLSTSIYRDQGFEHLSHILNCCCMETVSENAITWVHCATTNNKTLAPARFTVLLNVMIFCKDIQDFNKTMCTNYLSKIIEMCISVKVAKNQTVEALHCLENCLLLYPSTCGPLKNKIELYLLKFLDLQDANILVQKAGKCFNHLQQIGNGGSDSINFINNWTMAVKRLCKTTDILYDTFLENIVEFNNFENSNVLPYEFPLLASDTDRYKLLTVTEYRLRNISLFLRSMIETKYSAPNVINPQSFLDLVKRCLLLHTCIVNENYSLETSKFSILLIQHQIDLFYLLRSFIAMLHVNLIPFSTIITKILIDCLERTKKCHCFSTSSEYKKSLYVVLIFWIKTMKNNVNRALHDKLILTIINDIIPFKMDVSLNMTNVNNSGGSLKSKKKAIENRILASSINSNRNYSTCYLDVKEKDCCQALSCLKYIFEIIRVHITQETLNSVYTNIMKTLLQIQSGKTVLPYTSEETQIMLYEALVSVIDPFLSIIPPPVELALNILQRGLSSNNRKISEICYHGLNRLERMCQPICPPLNLAETSFKRNVNNKIVNFIEKTPITEKNNPIEEKSFISNDSTRKVKNNTEKRNVRPSVETDNSSVSTISDSKDECNTILPVVPVNSEQPITILESNTDALMKRTRTTTDAVDITSTSTVPSKVICTSSEYLKSKLTCTAEIVEEEYIESPKKAKLELIDNDIPDSSNLEHIDVDDMSASFVDSVVL